MKIGIDAKWYFEGPPSGKRVVRSLVDHMLAHDQENQYFIFLNAKNRNERFPVASNKNVTICYVWAGNNLLSNVFIIPFYSNRYRLDTVLYQNFVSPFDRSKTIAYIHDVLFLSNPEYYTVYERLYFSPLKILTRLSDFIITVSEEEKKRLLQFNFSKQAKKIAVVYHGVDESFRTIDKYSSESILEMKKRFNLPDNFLLYVGRLNLRKNIDNLLRAIPLLKNKTITLVVVGADDWKKSNHTQIIRHLGIEDRIQFTGALFKELGIVYSMAKIFCFPSYAESFGLPPLESMASGVPIVVSNTTSLPEICGAAGSYITPNDPIQIAGMIDNLLEHEDLYREKRLLGIEQSKKFTWTNAAVKVIDIMRVIVKK